MIQHVVTYQPDFSDNTVQKTLYFNLRLSALQQMINYEGWDQKLRWMGEEFDLNDLGHRRKLQEFWDVIIERSYGVRDGDTFDQSTDISKKFMGSAEYDALITDILYTQDSQVASKFIKGLFPRALVDQIKERGGDSPIDAQVAKLTEGN